ncbi:RAMP superfamily CRISPR-associated protein [Paenibacillus sp. SGZ-1009]|uniref:RAMP superfamily CRISPR-associated protein n=1 Tax=Paenibacillus campi TaxID=3106031 RepID=UPI002AFEB206|nr:RAMP superfamily CRISPR-associated protein [Paenibacillus sp. SGZ-1009]
MSVSKITIKLTTCSNLFIGGSPTTFEIGGVDAYTVTNAAQLPYIPSSSYKGIVRNIVREVSASDVDFQNRANQIAEAYRQYLQSAWKQAQEELERLSINSNQIESDRMERVKKRYEQVISKVSAEYLFGIEGFNDTPKLFFNDLEMDDTCAQKLKKENQVWYSIDSKNNIENSFENGIPQVKANPRTYKVVRPGISFSGDLLLHNLKKLEQSNTGVTEAQIKAFMVDVIDQLNDGIHRVGNSGSRGYGRVKVEFIGEGN